MYQRCKYWQNIVLLFNILWLMFAYYLVCVLGSLLLLFAIFNLLFVPLSAMLGSQRFRAGWR
jgi:hypothetical protein